MVVHKSETIHSFRIFSNWYVTCKIETLKFDDFSCTRETFKKMEQMNNPLKFFPKIFASGKRYFWNQHIKVVLEREFTVFYSQMPTLIITSAFSQIGP